MNIAIQNDAQALADRIQKRVGTPRWRLWFDRNTVFRREEESLIVGVPNRHFQEWLERTFQGDVAAAAQEVYGEELAIRFRIEPSLFQAARREHAEAALPPTPLTPDPIEEAKPQPERKARARRWRKLSDFVPGACNRVAHAAALSVAEAPGECPNPLVIHGPVGTGKTHLLEGIYGSVRKAHSGWKVTYLTAEEFTNRFLAAMRSDKLGAFRRQFRECDLLLIDDLHFLATKKATQEEFLHTFDALLADGRQLVVSCDCHPRLDESLSPELSDRLVGGAVWGLASPDAAQRLAILQFKSRAMDGLPIPPSVLKFLADGLRGNVRELEGALSSVRHYSRVTGRPLDVALVREALADLLRHSVRIATLKDVDGAVCAVLRLEPGTLQGKSRAWSVSHPRMTAMFLSRKHTTSSHAEIGAYFGGKNHSTVVASEKKVRGWLDNNEELALGDRRVRARELVERAERELGR